MSRGEQRAVGDTRAGGERAAPPGAELLAWLSDGCVVLDRELRCTWANRQACALLGLRADALLGRSLRAPELAAAGAVVAAFRAAAEGALADRAPRHVEAHEPAGDRWIEARVHPSPDGLLAVLADVSARKRAEAATSGELDELRRLVEQTPAFLWVVDRELRVRRMFGAASLLRRIGSDRLVGLTIDEGMRLADVPAEAQALWREMHRRALLGGAGEYLARYAGMAVEARVQPLRGPGGAIVGVLGIGLDVTEAERVREELWAREARFRALVEHGLELIAILDERGVHRYASPSYEVVLGYAPQELLGTNAFDYVHPEDVPMLGETLAPEALAGGPRPVPPVRIRHRDGSWRTLIGVATDMRGDPAVGGIVANGRDVTELFELEAQLRQAQKMDAVGQLAGGVAHDFNNLLTVIAGYSDFIRETTPEDDPRHRDAAEIRRAADRAALLTQQLLAFSRKQVLRPAVLDLNAAVEETGRMLRRVIGEDVALELRLAPGAVPALLDAGQLQQVLMNLAVNARDAMPSGGRITVETGEVTVAREEPAQPTPLPPGRWARLAVGDTGTGMGPDVLARAFEPFFTTKPSGKGTGLGLSTVYGIVTQSGGRLRVASAPGRGTTFELFFAPAAGAVAPAPAPTPGPPARGAETILLVEDDPMVRRLAEEALARAGYRVLAAPGPDDALRVAAREAAIDLVVTDVVMPGLSGPALAARLTAARPGLRVLYVSGYADDAVTRRGLGEERVRFLAKPFAPEALVRRVREVLDGEA